MIRKPWCKKYAFALRNLEPPMSQMGSTARISPRTDSDTYCRNAPEPDVNSTDWCILARASPIYRHDDVYSGVDDIGEDA